LDVEIKEKLKKGLTLTHKRVITEDMKGLLKLKKIL
jgi:hypothetical protein